MALTFSAPGLVLGAVLAQNVPDQPTKTELELLGGMFGSSPLGLVLLVALANQAVSASEGQSSGAGQTSGTGAGNGQPTGTGTGTGQPTGTGTGTGQPTGTGTGQPGPTQPPVAEAKVPDVTSAGSDQKAAGELIASRGLTLAANTTLTSEEPIGTIVGSNPAAGTIVPVATAVTLLISAGIEVPNVVNLTFAEAAAAIDFVGLKVSGDTFRKRTDTVVAQDPGAGSFASVGDSVRLTGPKPPSPQTTSTNRGRQSGRQLVKR
jgi:hypothetical protein